MIESAGRSFPVEIRHRGARGRRADRGRDGEDDPRGAGDRGRQRARLPARPARDRAHRRAPRRPAAGQLRCRPALRPARRQGAGRGDPPGARRPPQDRARHLDRRDLDHHRRRARRHRFRPVAPAALRAGDRPDPAGDGARQPRLRRPARRPRRQDGSPASRSGCGAPSRPRRCPPSRRRKSCRPICPALLLDCAAFGVADPGDAALPRSAAGTGARRGAGAASRPRRDRRGGPSDASGRSDAQARAAGAAGAHGRRGCAARDRPRLPPSLPC